MDIRARRDRMTSAVAGASEARALDLVERVPFLGRLVTEFVRIEFIDRCMLIAAQGLLALIPTFVVLVAFFPNLMGTGMHQFADATGLGPGGSSEITGAVSVDQVRAKTGVIGILITLLSATSFARAIQRMFERVWEQPHIGGLSGTRRCFLWLLGWLVSVQTVAGVSRLLDGDGVVPSVARLVLSAVLISAVWLVTSRLLLFGRVAWLQLVTGAVLTGVFQVLYTRGSGLVMPAYVRENAEQFGTLGVILSISTWMIGFGADPGHCRRRRACRVGGPDRPAHRQVVGGSGAVELGSTAAGGRANSSTMSRITAATTSKTMTVLPVGWSTIT